MYRNLAKVEEKIEVIAVLGKSYSEKLMVHFQFN